MKPSIAQNIMGVTARNWLHSQNQAFAVRQCRRVRQSRQNPRRPQVHTDAYGCTSSHPQFFMETAALSGEIWCTFRALFTECLREIRSDLKGSRDESD